MALLLAHETDDIRIAYERSGHSGNATKAQLNAAAQAVEDYLTTNASAISTAINAATSPVVLTAAQKKALVAHVIFAKYLRDK